MNADEIREFAIDQVALAMYGSQGAYCRSAVTPAVDALAAVGLLPTAVEHRELEDGWTGQLVRDDGTVTSEGKPCTRQRRYVAAWRTESALTAGTMRVTRVKLTPEQVAANRAYTDYILNKTAEVFELYEGFNAQGGPAERHAGDFTTFEPRPGKNFGYVADCPKCGAWLHREPHPYFTWEQGYQAAIDDMERGVDGTPGHEYTSNPYNLGGTEKEGAA